MRRHEIDHILNQILDRYERISDINITVGRPLQAEIDGELHPVEVKPPLVNLTPFQTELFALNLIQGSPHLIHSLLATGSCDCSYQLGLRTRFRVNIFSQRGAYSIILRKLDTHVPSISEMGLPDVFYKITEERNGLVLVTGATGSGKSTSLATMLRHINENRAIHVITLEDPIEFEYMHAKATFNQREYGLDFDTFANGLRSALRQAPKVILVGEMRDRETMEVALTASETGHLVMSTLHTIDAGQTINRIVGMFDPHEEDLIRMRLSEALRWIVAQRLVPKIDGGRCAALEIMASTMRTKELIARGESEEKQFYDIIEKGNTYGMNTFDQSLLKLYKEGQISEETARTFCSRRSVIIRGIDSIKAARGIATSDIQGLEMSTDSLGQRTQFPQSVGQGQGDLEILPDTTQSHPKFSSQREKRAEWRNTRTSPGRSGSRTISPKNPQQDIPLDLEMEDDNSR